MMESIRTGVQKPWFKFVLAIIVISFVFAGYFTSSAGGTSAEAIATVNGEEVTGSQWQNAIQSESARYGEQFDAMFPTEERKKQFRLNVLDKLINAELVSQEVSDLGFRASPSQIQKRVKEIPVFQENGSFSTAALDRFLVQRGWTRNYLQGLIADEITQSQFVNIFSSTQVAMPYEVETRVALEQQQRSVKALVIEAKPFEEKVSLTDEEINTYYQNNLGNYEIPEKLSVQYIELKVDDLKKDIQIPDEKISEYYSNNQELYREEEERRVAHILIKTDERSDEEALNTINTLAQRIESGEDFAEVAKAESEDFSAEQGGDLGFVGRGVMDGEFEKAMFELAQAGDVSAPVKTEFGYHLVKLLEVKEGEVRALEEVKDEIANRLKTDEAEKQFYIKKEKISTLAFENYRSLSPAAAEASLDIKTSDAFPPSGGDGVFANQDVVSEAYSQPVLMDERNSRAIEVSEGHLIVMRKAEHTQKRTKSLEEVKEEVTTALKIDKSRELAKQKGESLVAKLNDSENIDDEIAELNAEWKVGEKVRRNSSELGFDITRVAFKAPKPVDGKPVAVGEELLSGDFAVVQVTEVITPETAKLTEAEKKQAESRIRRSMQEIGYQAIIDAAKENADVVKFQERIEQQN
ncbi:SurA N-terminal domain-containing protein [Pleionea sediminis]|uniref:SurA N-terminal domain-containing protein n=1 Tax=Pleionea sediminis TaxID=2569479 RepID=UPI001186FFAE|nr:SurA N-terminal domain-containing protein [Pleionea sediminis]